MANILSSYEYYKKKWEETKPIRGRSEVVKPIGQRRRDWERVEHAVVDGQDVYIAHLYQTDVVKYYPDGSIGLTCGSWATPTTAEFIHTHSPFYCYKRYGKIWVNVHDDQGGTKTYPVAEQGELRLYARDVGHQVLYEPKETIMISKRVVDRKKAKDARAKIQGFLDWAKTFNKLSDGWIHNETREQFGTYKTQWWRAEWDYGLPKELVLGTWRTVINEPKVYEYLQTCDDDGYMRVYLTMFDDQNTAHDKKVAKVVPRLNDEGKPIPNHMMHLYDFKYEWAYVQRKIYELADKSVDIHKVVEVDVTGKAVTGVV